MTHMYFWARTDGIRTFRHALRAAYRTAISAAQILVHLCSPYRQNLKREVCGLRVLSVCVYFLFVFALIAAVSLAKYRLRAIELISLSAPITDPE